jgi:transcriptional regulator with XRE-family HTH domain
MLTTLVARAMVDPLRAYVRELRSLAGLTQQEVADRLGLTRRAYVLWETARTNDIKLGHARALIRLLGGSMQHLDMLDEMSADEARNLAIEWAKLSAPDRERAERARAKFARVIELSPNDPQQLAQLVEQLRNDARIDAQLLELITVFLDGRRSGRSSQG